MNYYNEHDKKAAAWLRELIRGGHIADGTVDERSIIDVRPGDLAGFVQCHFFAGIGGWSRALRLSGWPDERPVWTGSCPCQPFSDAGLGRGTADERHLWPAFFNLIAQCRPAVCFGEQVASKAALAWLDGVCADLEGAGYAVGAGDLCAAGVGSPQIRQRLYWMGHSLGVGRSAPRVNGTSCQEICAHKGEAPGTAGSRLSGFWQEYKLVRCRDKNDRRIPVEPEFHPLVDGLPGRVGLLRGYGNAIVPPLAAEFIEACKIFLT